MTKLPLQGLLVADFSQGVAGPYCAMLMGDLGAEVVKVEPPRGDWIRVVGRKVEAGMSPTYISMNRNKKAFCLEMKDPGGLEAARRLAGKSDLVVESFRPGVMKRFGLDYETLSAEKPSLIYTSITGFGNSGPYVDLPGADSVIQAMGGIMSINGEAGGDPLRFGMFMVDMITGMSAYQGVLAALLGRSNGGRGQYLSVSLLDAILSFQAPPLTEYLMYGALPERNGNVNSYVAPSGVFRTKDSFLMFTTLDHQWERGAKALGLESLLDDPRYVSNDTRLANRDSLLEKVRDKLAGRTTAQWLEILRKHDILCAPINDYEQVVADPQVLANGSLGTVDHPVFGGMPLIRNPVRFGGFPLEYTPAPILGEHTREVLTGVLEYSEAEAEGMIKAGTVKQAATQAEKA